MTLRQADTQREIDLERRDFNLAALFLWMRFTLTALSKAEKAWVKFLTSGFFLAFLTSFLSTVSLALFLAVRTLSFLTFLIADLMIGIAVILP